MITLVTAFRKFKGVFDSIQRSALYSWKNMPVVIPANEVDTINICSSYSNVKILSGVSRGIEKGYLTHVPFFKDLMQKALPSIKTTMIAFINSDIVLLNNFEELCLAAFEKYGFDIVITGTRYDARLNRPIQDDASYEGFLGEKRFLHEQNSSDIFITSKFIWRKILSGIPDFLMGRPRLNTWLHDYAERYNIKRYNCTNSLITLHCIHSPNRYSDNPDPSVVYNMSLWIPSGVQIKNWPDL